jgi:hypothetical protein
VESVTYWLKKASVYSSESGEEHARQKPKTSTVWVIAENPWLAAVWEAHSSTSALVISTE